MTREPGRTLPRNPETIAVINCLRAVAIGDVMTHSVLQEVMDEARVGQKKDYYNTVNSARAALQKEHGILFKTRPGLGYERLSAEDSVHHTKRIHKKISRSAGRGIREIRDVAWRDDGAKLSHSASVDSAISYHMLVMTKKINSEQSSLDVRATIDTVPTKDIQTLVDAVEEAFAKRAARK